jgi:tRNA U34 5-carboxymethylaminomethyl modifying GTPase MnmE/TrmE
MRLHQYDTTYGTSAESMCASAGGHGSAVAIIRLSGDAAVRVATSIFRRGPPVATTPEATTHQPPNSRNESQNGSGRHSQVDAAQSQALAQQYGFVPKSHRIYYGHAVSASGQLLDEVLLLPMLAPRSFTREDVVELHCHGGTVPARRLLDACLQVRLLGTCTAARPYFLRLRETRDTK